MILPMKQVVLLCMTSARSAALKALGQLGCVHVKVTVRDTEVLRRAGSEVAAVEQALRVLDIAKKRGTFAFKPTAAIEAEDLQLRPWGECPVEEINRRAETITYLRDEVIALTQQLRRYAPFGEVDPEQVTAVGLPMHLYRQPVALAKEASTAAANFVFGEEGGFIYGVLMADEALPSGAEEIPLPTSSTRTMKAQMAHYRELADAMVEQLAEGAEALAVKLHTIWKAKRADQCVIEVSENLLAYDEVACLTGYIPERDSEALLATAQCEGWGVALSEPSEEDVEVPVCLEPPRGFRAIGTLFKGLGILPGYTEGDISVPFYLFFSLFFAMLIGDAGYGAVMLAGVLAAAWKLRHVSAARPALLIFAVFSCSAILWGVLSGTYFGIAKDALPACLKALPTVAWLGNDSNVMFLCFLIGACHLSVARLWNALLLAPSIKALGELGWLGVTWSMFLLVSGIVVSWFTTPTWIWWMMGGSIGVILIPMVADIRREGINIGMLPLNVISAMGDIISYVRLFAVGLASVKVAENFNMMAMSLDLPVVVNVVAVALILLLGHGLNLAMGSLSILVHAVRLNTLEFSNAKGVTWSGVAYNPFKQTQQ